MMAQNEEEAWQMDMEKDFQKEIERWKGMEEKPVRNRTSFVTTRNTTPQATTMVHHHTQHHFHGISNKMSWFQWHPTAMASQPHGRG